MMKVAFIVLRECLEITILLGIIIAATKTIKSAHKLIVLGVVSGITAASIFTFFVKNLTVSLYGMGDEIFDVAVMLITILTMAWTITWMNGYSKLVRRDMENLSRKIEDGISSNIMLVVAVSMVVFREGTEIILFLYSVGVAKVSDISSASDYLIGISLGIFAGVIMGIFVYLGMIKYFSKYIFKASSILLTVIAAGIASEAAGILTSTGIITLYAEQMWDSSWLLDDRSLFGKIMTIFTGYDSKPNGMQLIFYFSTIVLILCMNKLSNFDKLKRMEKTK
jgi:high-affinity iron transporter